MTEKQKASAAKWREANKEKMRAYMREYMRRRRAKERAARPPKVKVPKPVKPPKPKREKAVMVVDEDRLLTQLTGGNLAQRLKRVLRRVPLDKSGEME